MRKFYIAYGWSEGPRHSKRLVEAAKNAGHHDGLSINLQLHLEVML